MKKATCKQLKGACDEILTGNTAEEMSEKSRNHAIEMFNKGDKAHLDAMQEMKSMSQEEQKKWYDDFVSSFDSLEEA